MDRAPTKDPLFLTAIHEAGHFISGISLGVPYEPIWITIKGLGRSLGSTRIHFKSSVSFERYVHYCLGGMVAELVYSLGRGAATGELPKEIPFEEVKKISDALFGGAGEDFEKLEQHDDYDDSVYGTGIIKSFHFMGEYFADLYDLAALLVSKTTLHRDEAFWFLRSLSLYQSQHWKRENALDREGNVLRPDLELMESATSVHMRLGGPEAFQKWSTRHEGAYDRIVIPASLKISNG